MTKSLRFLPDWIQEWWIWLTAIFLLTFVSFWPSFFSAIIHVETGLIIHGMSAIAWMLLTIIQALLIKSKWRKHHRTVGYIALILAIILIGSGFQVMQSMLLRDISTEGAISLVAIKFLYFDTIILILFSVFLWLAIKAARNRRIDLHMRLMTCTAIMPLEAALERTYIYGLPSLVPTFNVAFYCSVITLITILVILFGIEKRLNRSRWPFLALLICFVIMLLTTDIVANSNWFQSYATYYSNI